MQKINWKTNISIIDLILPTKKSQAKVSKSIEKKKKSGADEIKKSARVKFVSWVRHPDHIRWLYLPSSGLQACKLSYGFVYKRESSRKQETKKDQQEKPFSERSWREKINQKAIKRIIYKMKLTKELTKESHLQSKTD